MEQKTNTRGFCNIKECLETDNILSERGRCSQNSWNHVNSNSYSIISCPQRLLRVDRNRMVFILVWNRPDGSSVYSLSVSCNIVVHCFIAIRFSFLSAVARHSSPRLYGPTIMVHCSLAVFGILQASTLRIRFAFFVRSLHKIYKGKCTVSSGPWMQIYSKCLIIMIKPIIIVSIV